MPVDHLEVHLLLDVCPLYLGLEGANGEMITFIKKNTTVSAEKTETFSTYDDNQSEVLIQVFEGERSMTRDNKILGKLKLCGISPMLRGQPRIDICFDIGVHGILNVSAMETSTKLKEMIKIKNENSCLSEDEIERMVARAERYKAEDEANKKRIEANNDLESYCYFMKDSNSKILDSPKVDIQILEEIEELDNVIDEIIKWLENNLITERENLRRNNLFLKIS